MKNLSRRLSKYIILSQIFSMLVLSGCSQLIEGRQVDQIVEQVQVNQIIEPMLDIEVEVDGHLKLHFIDIGQADAILIQQINLDSTSNMLIDAGNNDDGHALVDYLKN